MKSQFRIYENDEKLMGIHAFLMTQVQLQLKRITDTDFGTLRVLLFSKRPRWVAICAPQHSMTALRA